MIIKNLRKNSKHRWLYSKLFQTFKEEIAILHKLFQRTGLREYLSIILWGQNNIDIKTWQEQRFKKQTNKNQKKTWQEQYKEGQLISLLDIDVEILGKMLANQIWWHIKSIIYHNKLSLFQEWKGGLTFDNNWFIYHINREKRKKIIGSLW